jgi:malonate-semialdehyde dehydrogenase (acetylating)/methylmalonate-semialdehyde dehydrogenase
MSADEHGATGNMNIVGHFVNGQKVQGQGRTRNVFNPALGKAVRQVAMADQALVDAAISAASEALPSWRNTPSL